MDPVVSSLIGGVAGVGIAGYAKDRFLLGYTLKTQQKHAQRKLMGKLQAQYKGRVLEAVLDWDRRMKQLYEGAYVDLNPPDDRREDPEEYYFHSVVFRFLQLETIARRFEAEAFYIDQTFASSKKDSNLLRHCKAFLWVMLHAELSPDDDQPGRDHFRSDTFRPILDLCVARPGPVDTDGGTLPLPETLSRDGDLVFDLARYLELVRSKDRLRRARDIDELLAFFDEVKPEEYDGTRQRRRWDRLVALHLLTMVFIEDCGYDWQHRDVDGQITTAVTMLMDPANLKKELDAALPRLGFEDEPHTQKVRTCLDAAIERIGHTETDRERAERVCLAIQRKRVERELPPKSAVELGFTFQDVAAEPSRHFRPGGAERPTPSVLADERRGRVADVE